MRMNHPILIGIASTILGVAVGVLSVFWFLDAGSYVPAPWIFTFLFPFAAAIFGLFSSTVGLYEILREKPRERSQLLGALLGAVNILLSVAVFAFWGLVASLMLFIPR